MSVRYTEVNHRHIHTTVCCSPRFSSSRARLTCAVATENVVYVAGSLPLRWRRRVLRSLDGCSLAMWLYIAVPRPATLLRDGRTGATGQACTSGTRVWTDCQPIRCMWRPPRDDSLRHCSGAACTRREISATWGLNRLHKMVLGSNFSLRKVKVTGRTCT